LDFVAELHEVLLAEIVSDRLARGKREREGRLAPVRDRQLHWSVEDAGRFVIQLGRR
jgi:hypothetical protein